MWWIPVIFLIVGGISTLMTYWISRKKSSGEKEGGAGAPEEATGEKPAAPSDKDRAKKWKERNEWFKLITGIVLLVAFAVATALWLDRLAYNGRTFGQTVYHKAGETQPAEITRLQVTDRDWTYLPAKPGRIPKFRTIPDEPLRVRLPKCSTCKRPSEDHLLPKGTWAKIDFCPHQTAWGLRAPERHPPIDLEVWWN